MEIAKDNIITIPQGLNKMLLLKYPDLTPTELKISAMLTLNLPNKDIVKLTGRSIRTIEFTRYNIRKKMNLKPGKCLVKHLILLTDERYGEAYPDDLYFKKKRRVKIQNDKL